MLEQLKSLQTQNTQLQQQLHQSTTQFNSLKVFHNTIYCLFHQAHNMQLKALLDQAPNQGVVEELQSKVAAKTKEITSLKENMEVKTNEIAVLMSKVSILENEISEVNCFWNCVYTQVKAKKELEKYKKNALEKEAIIRDLQKQIENATKVKMSCELLTELKMNAAEKEKVSEEEGGKETAEQYKLQVAQLSKTIESQKKEILQLQQELEKERKASEKLNTKLERVKERADSHNIQQQENAELKNLIDAEKKVCYFILI